jgi:hypothetical protein
MSQVVCKSGERIRIGGNIEIVIVRAGPGVVELSINLPPGVAVCKQLAAADAGQRSVDTFYATESDEKSPYLVECD